MGYYDISGSEKFEATIVSTEKILSDRYMYIYFGRDQLVEYFANHCAHCRPCSLIFLVVVVVVVVVLIDGDYHTSTL